MKKYFSYLLLLLFFFNNYINAAIIGGEGAGNGGGAWVCRNNDNLNSIRWIRLVDLYEAEKEFLLPIKKFGNKNYLEIVDTQKFKLFSINPELYKNLINYFDIFDRNSREINVELETIDDALYRVKPRKSDCLNGEVSYAQLANFTHYGKILINSSLFNNSKLSSIDKAALVFHEVIYAYLRDKYKDKDSTRARKLVGLLFSDLKNIEIADRVKIILSSENNNFVKMVFVKIPAGHFMMGSNIKKHQDNNERKRKVLITRDFEIMKTEVTQLMYFNITGKNPSRFKKKKHCNDSFLHMWSDTLSRKVKICPNYPVESISYEQVIQFINQLNKQKKENYRLPTEAEWEYAARGNKTTDYFYGDSPNARLIDNGISQLNSNNQTDKAGPARSFSNKRNSYGLYDMQGNVWEFTQDRYSKKPEQLIDPLVTDGDYIVARGGSFRSNIDIFRFSFRQLVPLRYRGDSIGFRLVRTIH